VSLPRVLPFGERSAPVAARLEAQGFPVVRSDPDVVLCHGGDGTLLRAERRFPGVPKLPVRVGSGARLCSRHQLDAVLQALADGRLASELLDLLWLSVGRARFRALNDVTLRNENPALAVRFHLEVDGVRSREFTGDGLGVATGQSIASGLAVAFNNTTRVVEPLELTPDSEILVHLERGPAVLVHDNDPRYVRLRQGHRFGVRLADEKAELLGLDGLRCQDCRRYDHGQFNPH
jgi:NAD+ kinase